jgi:phage terminase large subunit-like protein
MTIHYDPWNASQLAQDLIADSLPMRKFIQGPKSYHPAMQEFERVYSAARLNHANDPVLTWNAANLIPRFDVNLNMAPDRKKSADKIDGLVALLMAFGGAISDEKPFDFQELVIV